MMQSKLFVPLTDEVFTKFNHDLDVSVNKFYHYTSGNSIFGIIDKMELWATNASFLNDKSEILYSENLIRDYIDTQLKSNSKITWLQIYLDKLNNEKIPEIYLISFSKRHDDLSQWRGYGYIGNSYCIEFDKYKLDSCILEYGSMFNVIYDSIKQTEIIDYVFNLANKHYVSLSSDSSFAMDDFITYFHYVVLLLIPIFKNIKFSSEEEIRIVIREEAVARHQGKILHKIGTNCIIPYYPLCLSRQGATPIEFPIESITIGPNIDYIIAEKGLKSFISEKYNGFGNLVQIYKTEIPYRI